jgi:hypothetical protein
MDKLRLQTSQSGESLSSLILLQGQLALLRRLGISASPPEYVLRGSFLTRFWSGFTRRTAADLDFLVVGHRYSPDLDFAEFVQNQTIQDGIVFHGPIQSKQLFETSAFPGRRLTLTYAIDSVDYQMSVDIGWYDPLVPAAAWVSIPNPIHDGAVGVYAVRPETQIGWKMHSLAVLGASRWRPKDLADIWLIAMNQSLDHESMMLSIRSAFQSREMSINDAIKLFSEATWLNKKLARLRWEEALEMTPWLKLIPTLGEITTEIQNKFVSILSQLQSESAETQSITPWIGE